MSALVRITPPDGAPISLEEAKEHAVANDFDDDDELIHSMIQAATEEIDGKDGWLGRALLTQTWELRLDWGFPCQIGLPLPPVQSITSIKYTDTAGAEQTLASDQYVLLESEPAVIVPAYGVTWPTTRCDHNVVRVRYVCGYGDMLAVPELIRHWLKLRLSTLLEHREEVIVGTIVARNPALDNMLENLRVR